MSEDCKCATIDPCCKEAVDCSPRYKIRATISEKFYNEEVGKYLIPAINRNEPVLVSNTKEIEFLTSEIWRVTDSLYEDKFDSITIIKVKDGIN